MTLVTLGELLDAGVHFGHQSSRWNPKMFPYIYTEQNGIHVIDLVQTARLLAHAYNYVQKASKEGKISGSTCCRKIMKRHSTIRPRHN